MRSLTKIIFLVCMCVIFAIPAFCQNDTRIAIYPFAIHSKANLDYFSKELPHFLKRYLILAGVSQVQEMSAPSNDWQFDEQEIAFIRKESENLDVTHAIWGTFFQKEQGFDLKIAMVDTLYQSPVRFFEVDGADIVNLNASVKDLAKQISNSILDIPVINNIVILGNERMGTDSIMRAMNTKIGDPYIPARLSQDLEIIYRMGYFDDIRIEAETDPDSGLTVIFHVKEKPTIYKILIKGNSVFDEEKIRENIDISMGSILNIYNVQENISRIEAMYKEKNYHNVQVDYELKSKDHNQTEIIFRITENDKVYIRKITFVGNKDYTEEDLEDLMANQEKGFWSFFTSSGNLDSEKLQHDVMRLQNHYHNNGYIDARIGEPQVVIKKTKIEITIKVFEGKKYEVGDIDITGDLILPKKKMIKLLKLKSKKLYKRESIREDLTFLTDLYGNAGYAYADIYPKVKKEDMENKSIVHISYHIDQGNKVYFDRIVITGNTKTRDKVIRRRLRIFEQELYSGIGIKHSINELKRLDFFEDVQVDTQKGTRPNTMDLKITVKEKPTGMFTLGGGYSSVDHAFVMGSISKRNLFGRGQILEAKGQIGGSTNQFNISFTEPWLFDMPLSFGIDLFNWTREYDEYDKDSKGAGVRLGYPIFRNTRGYISYRYDRAEIYNLQYDAPYSIRNVEGVNETNSTTVSLRYDTTDHPFNPSRGMDHSISVEYAGGFLGGDIGFTKYRLEMSKFFPLFWHTVFLIHAEGGYVKERSDEIIPDYELFHLGGINSLRGFEWEDLSPEEDVVYSYNLDGSKNYVTTKVGGNKYVQFNVEFIFPIVRQHGLVGLFFYDTGSVQKDGYRIQFDELRESAGYGIRWFSPMGPIRLEYGYILDPKGDESSDGRWEFTIGTMF